MVFVGANFVDTKAAVVWWQASATPGAYDFNFETFTDHILDVTTSTPAITLSGTSRPCSPHRPTSTPGALDHIHRFHARVHNRATATTKDVYLQSFNTSGQAVTGLIEAFTNVNDHLMINPGLGDNNGLYWSEVNGANTGFYGENYNPTTGALGGHTRSYRTPHSPRSMRRAAQVTTRTIKI